MTELARSHLPDWLVCPACRGGLFDGVAAVRCGGCGRVYPRLAGTLQLLVDPTDRFEDVRDAERDIQEERFNDHVTRQFLLPLLRTLVARPAERAASDAPRVLSVGCGVAADVDLLNEEGFAAHGVDCGERIWAWSRRRYAAQLHVANAKRLPFASGSFDVVAAGCLLPHVGVIGDSSRVRPDYAMQRRAVAAEIVRVVRPGGYVVLASPNRRCPLDLWHLHDGRRIVRGHSPREPFLLSLEDYAQLFVEEAGCRSVATLPPDGYFSFAERSARPLQRFLVPLVRSYFRWLSTGCGRRLRGSGLDPWLILLVRK